MNQKTVSLGVLDGATPEGWSPWRNQTLQVLLHGLPACRATFLTADEFRDIHVIVQPELKPLRALFDSPGIAAVVGVLVDPIGHDAAAIASYHQTLTDDFRSLCQKLRREPEAAYRIFGFSIFLLAEGTRYKESIVRLKRSMEDITAYRLWDDSKARGCRCVILTAEVALKVEIENYINSMHEALIGYVESRVD